MNLTETSYSIPVKFRKMENLHIVFWLFKDISWCLEFKFLGIAMIFPTLIIAIVIAYRNRQYVSEVAHNVSIIFWISANSYWMVSEFFGFDKNIVWGSVTFKHLAIIPFAIGIIILAYYYLYWRLTHKEEIETM